MSKQPSTVQTTQNSSTQVAPYVSAAQQNLLGYGNSILGNFLNQTPNYAVAGFNPDQTQAFDLARQQATNQFSTTTPTPTAPMDALAGSASMASAAQLDPGNISAFMNPFVSNVMDANNANLRRQYGQTSADMGAQAAAAGTFGGSRNAIQQGQLARALGDQIATSGANLLSQGWQQAAGLAQGNVQNQQAANLANAAAQNTRNYQNASLNQNAFSLNQNAEQQRFARQQQALSTLLGVGNQQQSWLQNALNVPQSALQQYGAIVPNQYPTSTSTVGTAPNTAPSLGQQILGGGLTLLGMGTNTLGGSLLGGLFCDERLKKDIAPAGFDASGRPIFAFRYAWDEDGAPLRYGPMAQVEEARDPDSVFEVLGIKIVRH